MKRNARITSGEVLEIAVDREPDDVESKAILTKAARAVIHRSRFKHVEFEPPSAAFGARATLTGLDPGERAMLAAVVRAIMQSSGWTVT